MHKKIISGFVLLTALCVAALLSACVPAGTSKDSTSGVDGSSSPSNRLVALTLDGAALTPLFDPQTHDYLLTVSTPYVVLNAQSESGSALLTINSEAMQSGKDKILNLRNGENVFAISVSDAGMEENTYNITIVRQSSNADLIALDLSAVMNPAFDSSTTNYSASVDYNVSSVTFNARVSDVNATLYNDGATILSGTDQLVNLAPGDNVVSLSVTAEDGSEKIYTLTIHRSTNVPASSNADLTELTLSSGMTPAFSSSATSYSASVSYATAGVTLNAVAVDINAHIDVNGSTVVSGVNQPVNLAHGDNIINVTVTAVDGNTKTYTVTIHRSTTVPDFYLSSLTLSSGMAPAFASGTTSYSVTVGHQINSVTLNAVTSDANATLSLNGNTVISGTNQTINLVDGDNIVELVVTVADGSTKTYTVNINRSTLSSIVDLASLTISAGVLNPVFDSTVTDYTVTVPYAINAIDVTATPENAQAELSVNGVVATHGLPVSTNLSVGNNVIDIQIAASTLASKLYRLTVTRQAASTDASLSALAINGEILKPGFASNVYQYSMLVKGDAATVDITATANDTMHQSLVINSSAATSGVANSVALSPGENTINVDIVAEDGVSSQSYTLTITRPYSYVRGINLPNNSAVILSEADVQRWRTWGVNTVRIHFNKDDESDPYTDAPTANDIWLPYTNSKARLQTWIGWLANSGIQAIISLDYIWGDDHNTTAMWGNGGNNQYLQHRIQLAVAMAEWLSGFNNAVALELWNEPHPYSSIYRDYFLAETINQIRTVNQDIGLIAMSPYDWGLPPGLNSWSGVPGADDRLVYSTHFYNPWTYTHQGILGNPTDTVGWPGNHKDYPTSSLTYYDLTWMRAQVASLASFEARSGSKVIITEFGVLRWAIDNDKYVGDWITAFEESNISWIYHSFGGWNGFNPSFAAGDAESALPYGGVETPTLIVLKNYWQLNFP